MRMETFLIIHVSFQAGSAKSNCDVVNKIIDSTACHWDSYLSQSSCRCHIYVDRTLSAIAAIAYKENYLVMCKCGQCC